MIEQFKKWLEKNKPKSLKHYASGYNTINRISLENNLCQLEDWSNETWDKYYNDLIEIEEFKELNISGNNILTATLSNLRKSIMDNKKSIVIPPIIPFPEFKWRWAVTTPSEGINKKEILFGVLKVLVAHNGKKHGTQEFKKDLSKLQSTLDTKIDLAKEDRDLNKNIIENSGQYWKALGLINSTSDGTISVSELGLGIVDGSIANLDFMKKLYNEFQLPNHNIENKTTIDIWNKNGVTVYPFRIIFNVLLVLSKITQSPTNWYLTPEELRDIIIPLSVYEDLDYSIYVDNILKYRENKTQFSSWPNCAPGDNDFRMIKEYLLFLSSFGFLDLIELKDGTKRYYINSLTLNVMEESISLEKDNLIIKSSINDIDFELKKVVNDILSSGLLYDSNLIARFIASLLTKPFVILTGLSGSGKTKLAQAFVQWICQDDNQYRIIPVGADWTNREPLLGYPNALNPKEYVKPDSGVLDLVIQAISKPDLPHFLILDEMNLSHVERYFADFLSVMESKNDIPLYSGIGIENVPSKLCIPSNLFIIGTVNIDETTNMFSPKVLDRANTIEFRVSDEEMDNFLQNIEEVNMDALNTKGTSMAKSFLQHSTNNSFVTTDVEDINKILVKFFGELKKTGAEFGYRTASEIRKLINQLSVLDDSLSIEQKLDIAIMQKLLPKLHGSRRKLCPVLETLGSFCISSDIKVVKDIFEKEDFDFVNNKNIIYHLSLEKITRMYKGAIDNGFTSFAEA